MFPSSHPWQAQITRSDKPRYLAIADAIAEDMRDGRLMPGDRLPPQRTLAEALELDFTTVARGYQEAQRRGLIESRVGAGTFVKGGGTPAATPGAPSTAALADRPPAFPSAAPRRNADLSMNLPPDITDPALVARMQAAWATVGQDLVGLLRYQEFGGGEADRQAGAAWLRQSGMTVDTDRLLVCAGTHSTLHGVLGSLTRPGDVICTEALTYPGVRGLAAQSGLEIIGLPMDGQGILPDAFAAVCHTRPPKALYCNPTLQNPTTITLPLDRRQALVDIARRHGVTIIEDDAYGALPIDPPPALARLAPDIVFYIGGLSKILGAGLRVAYLAVPDTRHVWQLSAFLRATTVMASPITVALASRWIEDGTAAAMRESVRAESSLRQTLARDILPGPKPSAKAEAFHYWLPLPPGWNRASFAATLRGLSLRGLPPGGLPLGVAVSDAFCIDSPAPEAVRLCLGGGGREETRSALEMIAHTLSRPPQLASVFL